MKPATIYATPDGDEFIENSRKQENPCLLWVCNKSRTAYLQRYQLAPNIRKKTYVNFDLDTIYIEFYDDQYFYLPLYEIESWPQIQYLAVDLEWLFKFGIESLLVRLSQCQTLQKATFVIKSITVDKEYEVNITNIVTKYEDMEFIDKLLYFEQSRGPKILDLAFSRQCETIAILELESECWRLDLVLAFDML
jgi:hypothetical protein